MSALAEAPTISSQDEYREAIRRAFSAIPVELRSEIVDGDIIVSPMRSNADQRVILFLNQLLTTTAAAHGWWVDTSGGIVLEPDREEYRPDLQVAPSSAWLREGGTGPSPSEVKLVVEVASPNEYARVRDRGRKYAAYARAGLPLYLLIDRYDHDGIATLYSNPYTDIYLDAHKAPFGETLTLPKPFDVVVDTGRF